MWCLAPPDAEESGRDINRSLQRLLSRHSGVPCPVAGCFLAPSCMQLQLATWCCPSTQGHRVCHAAAPDSCAGWASLVSCRCLGLIQKWFAGPVADLGFVPSFSTQELSLQLADGTQAQVLLICCRPLHDYVGCDPADRCLKSAAARPGNCQLQPSRQCMPCRANDDWLQVAQWLAGAPQLNRLQWGCIPKAGYRHGGVVGERSLLQCAPRLGTCFTEALLKQHAPAAASQGAVGLQFPTGASSHLP